MYVYMCMYGMYLYFVCLHFCVSSSCDVSVVFVVYVQWVHVQCIVVDGSLWVYVCFYILYASLWFACSMSVLLCVCVCMLYILLFVCSILVYVRYVVYIALCQCVACMTVVCVWCPNSSSWHMDRRIYASIFHTSLSLTSFSGSMLEKSISGLCLLLRSSSLTMLRYLGPTFESTFIPTSICAHGPLVFLCHPLILFLRGRSRSDFLLQLSWCFLFILERCLNKGLDALLLLPRCLSWQRSSADGTKLRG